MSRKGKVGPAHPSFQLEDYILYNLNRVSAVYTDEMSAALKSHGLSSLEWRLLMLLDDKSPCSVGDLARRAVSKMPTVTRVLMRMQEDGLVQRSAQEGDRRFVQITMTPKANEKLKAVKALGQNVFERALGDVSQSDADIVVNVLKQIRENLQRSPYEDVAPPSRRRAER